MLADELDYVVGVDTHRDEHMLGGRRGARRGLWWRRQAVQRERARLRGGAAVRAASTRSGARVWAIEGTGSYGAGLARLPRRPRRDGARDQPHAREPSDGCAARTTRSTRRGRRARRLPARRSHCRAAGERREALRLLLVARRSAVDVRREALVQLRSVIVTAPDQLRERAARAARRAAARPLQPPAPLELGARPTSSRRGSCCAASPAGSRLRPWKPTSSSARSSPTSARSHPQLLDEPGVGPIVAAQLIVSWSHHGRVRSEAAFARLAGVAPIPASSGQTTRHRLSRGGDRQLNRALHTVVLHRRQHDPATKAYIERRVAEGKSRTRRHPPPQALPRPPPLPRHSNQEPLMT